MQIATAALAEFVAVAKLLSFTNAARELRLHPSVLTRRIKDLEQRLGVRLLNRNTRQVTLTEPGAAFLARAVDILARLDDAEAEISHYASEPHGTLRLALPNVFGQLQIAPLLPDFMERYPAVRMELSFRDTIVDLVADGFDAAIRIGALDAGGDVLVRRLAANRRVICAAPDYLERHGWPQHPEDLRHHRILHFAPLLTGRIWRLVGPDGVIEIPVEPALVADNIGALRHAALAGQGITVLATFVAGQDFANGRLVPVFRDIQPEESTVSIVYQNAAFVPRKVRALVDFLIERLAGTPPWEVPRKDGHADDR
jgi:DNA-binding transcriptional LysR family regulator